jgi:hypothetical protein
MNTDEPLQISGCELCDIFLKKNIKTKLYWPDSIDKIQNSEFVIVDCQTCKIPMLVYRDHVTTITREAWGRILYRCKEIFGSGITLRSKPRRIFDHFHCHIVNIDKY